MKLHLTKAAGNQLITGYGAGWIQVNELRYTQSLIVLPELVIPNWNVQDFSDLTEAHFEKLIASTSVGANSVRAKLEVVLLGTGEKHQFVHPKLSRALIEAGIGIECMDTAAACRTYNILMAEGRSVAAALII